MSQAPVKEEEEEAAHSVVSGISNQVKAANSPAEEEIVASEEAEEVPEDDRVDYKSLAVSNDTEEDNEVAEILHSGDNEVSNEW